MDSPIGLTAGPVILTVPKLYKHLGTVSIERGVQTLKTLLEFPLRARNS